MKIYTRTGDDGSTALYGGARRSKSDLRVVAYGEVDELQASLGVCKACCHEAATAHALILAGLQQDCFILSCELARTKTETSRKDPVLGEERVAAVEGIIDELELALPPLKNFILPGGTILAAELHRARTICRRAERAAVQLHEQEAVRALVLHYLNRLSDLLFVMARTVNHQAGVEEVIVRG
jgi:cob(I)alamin adenosyltransferase